MWSTLQKTELRYYYCPINERQAPNSASVNDYYGQGSLAPDLNFLMIKMWLFIQCFQTYLSKATMSSAEMPCGLPPRGKTCQSSRMRALGLPYLPQLHHNTLLSLTYWHSILRYLLLHLFQTAQTFFNHQVKPALFISDWEAAE